MHRSWQGLVVALTTLGAVAVPAATAQVRARAPVSGPALAGDLVVWADARDDGGFDVRSAPVAAGEVRTILTVEGTKAFKYQPRLAASAQAVAVEVLDNRRGSKGTGGGNEHHRAFAGPPTGPLEPVGERCGLAGNPLEPRSIDVDGDAVLFENCEGQRSLEVRRVGVAAQLPERFSGEGRGLRLAGRFAAWVDGFTGGLSVYDRDARGLAYRVPAEQSGSVSALDLQADGKLVYAGFIPGSTKRRVGWVAPDRATVQTLPVAGGRGYGVRLAADQAAFVRTRDPRKPRPGGEVGIVPLTGGSETLVAKGVAFEYAEPPLDYDGTRIAYATYNCSDATIHVTPANTKLREFGQRRGCPLALERAPSVRSNLSRARLALDCFGFLDGECFSRKIELRHAGVVMGAGPAQRIVLTMRARQLLAARGKLRVTASGILEDRGGREERRNASITLRRP